MQPGRARAPGHGQRRPDRDERQERTRKHAARGHQRAPGGLVTPAAALAPLLAAAAGAGVGWVLLAVAGEHGSDGRLTAIIRTK